MKGGRRRVGRHPAPAVVNYSRNLCALRRCALARVEGLSIQADGVSPAKRKEIAMLTTLIVFPVLVGILVLEAFRIQR